MSSEIEMTSVYYVKKKLRFTISNKFYLLNPVIKQIHKIINIKMGADLLY